MFFVVVLSATATTAFSKTITAERCVKFVVTPNDTTDFAVENCQRDTKSNVSGDGNEDHKGVWVCPCTDGYILNFSYSNVTDYDVRIDKSWFEPKFEGFNASKEPIFSLNPQVSSDNIILRLYSLSHPIITDNTSLNLSAGVIYGNGNNVGVEPPTDETITVPLTKYYIFGVLLLVAIVLFFIFTYEGSEKSDITYSEIQKILDEEGKK